MVYSTSGAAVAALAVARALKASGVIIQVDAENFRTILAKAEKPVVVMAAGGLFKKNYQYLTSYKGLAFFTKSGTILDLPSNIELIAAGKIWIPE